MSDLQNKGDIPVTQPRIYYGPMITDYSIVGSDRHSRVRQRRRQRPDEYYSYNGKGGVGVGNLFERLVFATQYGEANFLFSSEITGNSQDHVHPRSAGAGGEGGARS